MCLRQINMIIVCVLSYFIVYQVNHIRANYKCSQELMFHDQVQQLSSFKQKKWSKKHNSQLSCQNNLNQINKKPSITSFCSMATLNNIFLEDQQNAVPEDKVSITKYQLKIQHLNDLNKRIYLEKEQLKKKIHSLEQQNRDILSSRFDENDVINRLRHEVQKEKNKNDDLSKQIEKLLATILLNEQLEVQARKESNSYVNRYEQKVLQLRQNLQMKQVQVQTLQEKYEKFRFLQLPMNVKNTTRFTAQLLKYEALIDQLIRERSHTLNKDNDEISHVLFQLNFQAQISKKTKKDKTTKTTMATDVRPNLVSLSNESPYGQLDQEKLDVIFLRLHYELRTLKKKYRQRLEQITELKSKDKIMKQGYNTLTKEMQKVKNKNCQLTIQLQHSNKKLLITKELSQARSVGNIQSKRTLQRQNAEQKISSQVSIEGNCSMLKHRNKGTLPSQTKHDTLEVTKSHNFDQRIQNIQGLLSLDSNPDFSNLKNKRGTRQDQNDEQLSVCEQNSVDMSISLDASGFEAPDKNHHEISENILTGLIDKKVF